METNGSWELVAYSIGKYALKWDQSQKGGSVPLRLPKIFHARRSICKKLFRDLGIPCPMFAGTRGNSNSPKEPREEKAEEKPKINSNAPSSI